MGVGGGPLRFKAMEPRSGKFKGIAPRSGAEGEYYREKEKAPRSGAKRKYQESRIPSYHNIVARDALVVATPVRYLLERYPLHTFRSRTDLARATPAPQPFLERSPIGRAALVWLQQLLPHHFFERSPYSKSRPGLAATTPAASLSQALSP